MKVPYNDLYQQYLGLKDEFDSIIQDVLQSSAFIGGQYVRDFEAKFSSYVNTTHAVASANGTDAIEIVLKALGIGPGDEVIVPALTWISTAEAVCNIGAVPRFADIDEQTYVLNPLCLDALLNEKTRAIIPVHLYGHPAPMGPILSFAQKHGLKVIEDCAQAHGAEYEGKRVGSLGDAGTFSFYPGKNLGAMGDAGAIVTNDQGVADVARMLCNHGQLGRKHHHEIVGRNSRMDGLNAAILSLKLDHIEVWNEKRIELASRYDSALQGLSYALPMRKDNARHVYHVYALRSEERDAVRKALSDEGVSTAVHYPHPLPEMKCFSEMQPASCPVAKSVCSTLISLPLYPEMPIEHHSYVCSELSKLSK